MSKKSKEKQHSLPPTNVISKSTKKKSKKKKSIPPCEPDSSTSHTRQESNTGKKRKKSRAQPPQSNRNSERLNTLESNAAQPHPLTPTTSTTHTTTVDENIKHSSSLQSNQKRPNHSSHTNNRNSTKGKKNKNTNPPPQPNRINQTPHTLVKEQAPNACPDPNTPERRHQSTSIPAISITPSQPNLDNPTKTKKKEKKKKKQRTTVTPSSHTSLPILNPSQFYDACKSARTQTSLTDSSCTRPPSPFVSPPFRAETCYREKRTTPPQKHLRLRTDRSNNSQNHATQPDTKRRKTVTGAHFTSPVPLKCTNESDTSTQPPVHSPESPDPSPCLTLSHNLPAAHAVTQPFRTNLTARRTLYSNASAGHDLQKDVCTDPEHVSIDHHRNMPRYQNQQNLEHTWFHVGTNNDQHRSPIRNYNHEGTTLRCSPRTLERTYPNARARKGSSTDGGYGQVTGTNDPILSHASWNPSEDQRNAYGGQPYSIQGNRSVRQPFHAYERHDASKNQSARAQTSVHAQSDPFPYRNVAQHDGYRRGSYRAPSQHRYTPQQPLQFPNGMQIDQRAKQPMNKPNSTRNGAQNPNDPSTIRQSGVQSSKRRSEQTNNQMSCTASIRDGQSRCITANPSVQPFSGLPSSSAKASRMSLQKKTASPTGEYYGIRCGRDGFSGVTTCWKSCSVFVVGYRDAVYEVFDTWEKAERFSDRCGTGASITHRSNFRHFFGGRRNGVMHRGSVGQLSWEHENEPQVVSLVIGAAWLRFGIGSGIGGYGVFLSLNNPYNCAGLMEGNVTELRLQLKGLLEALEIVHQHGLVRDGGTVEVYTASQEVKNGIDHWLGRWDKSGRWVRDGKPVGSQDLWKAILKIRNELLEKGTRIHIIWIRRPNKVPALQQAVSLARVVFNSATTDEGRKRSLNE